MATLDTTYLAWLRVYSRCSKFECANVEMQMRPERFSIEDNCKWIMTFILGWTNLLKKSSLWSALMLSGSLNYNISILIREACDISKHICTSASRNWMIIQTLLIAPSFTEVKQETICCRDADNTLFTRHPSDFRFIRWI